MAREEHELENVSESEHVNSQAKRLATDSIKVRQSDQRVVGDVFAIRASFQDLGAKLGLHVRVLGQ